MPANTNQYGTAGFQPTSFWVANTAASDNETFTGLKSTTGTTNLGDTQVQHFSEFTFKVGALTYRYAGDWTITAQHGLLTDTISVEGTYSRIYVEKAGVVISDASPITPLHVDFGSQTGLSLLGVGPVLNSVITTIFGPGAPQAYANLHTDVSPNIETESHIGDNINGSTVADLMFGDKLDNLMRGNAGNDSMRGDNGNDTMYGDVGNDQILGLNGNDLIYGGDGADDARGGAGHDTIFGQKDVDTLRGEAGNDSLDGGDGNDLIFGGVGHDTMVGGTGNDRFYFDSFKAADTDVISDFMPKGDRIGFAISTFDTLDSTGALMKTEFHVGTAAADAADRIIYNPTTGGILYDHDGAGGDAAMLVVTVATGLNLTHTDFFVY